LIGSIFGWVDPKGTNDYAHEVTLSHKGVKSRTRVTGLRSKRTKARINVDRLAANVDLKKKLAEALEQQAATSEVLQVISTSSGELEPIFRTILAKATDICEAKFGTLYLYESGAFHAVALHNAPAAYAEARTSNLLFQPAPDLPLGRIIITKQAVQLEDVKLTRSYVEGDPLVRTGVDLGGYRTVLAVPMLKNDVLIGAISIRRQEVRPFTNKQIALVTNFAAQAVIAIENTRLLNELRESLQQQTATADVLKVISSSPGELEPVFEALLAKAVRLCEAKFGSLFLGQGETYRIAAMNNAPAAYEALRRSEPVIHVSHPAVQAVIGRLRETRETVCIDDLMAQPPEMHGALVKLALARTLIAVPMLKEDELIGAIVIYRQEVRRFSEKQIELVKNFARQAVIAIENTRLLNELRESLQQHRSSRKRSGSI
jgi:GAF domain-containing protein